MNSLKLFIYLWEFLTNSCYAYFKSYIFLPLSITSSYNYIYIYIYMYFLQDERLCCIGNAAKVLKILNDFGWENRTKVYVTPSPRCWSALCGVAMVSISDYAILVILAEAWALWALAHFTLSGYLDCRCWPTCACHWQSHVYKVSDYIHIRILH